MRKWAVLCLISLLFITGCSRTKDIMAVASIKSLDNLTITDRTGNQVLVEDPASFEAAFKEAVPKKDGDKLGLSLLVADYRLEASGATFYYFQDDNYLVFQDGAKAHVYQAQLTELIASEFTSQPQEPGVGITEGAPNQEVEDLAAMLAQVQNPVAYLLDHGDQSVFIFAAGEQDTAEVSVTVDKTTPSGRGYIIDFTVHKPEGSSASSQVYPYAILTFSEKVHAIARTTEGNQVKEWPTIAMEEGQRVVLLQPRRGSLLTQRVTLVGKASVPGGHLHVEIEDGHAILAQKDINLDQAEPRWGDFEVTLDLKMPTNLSGTIVFFSEIDGVRQEHLLVPVLFTGGK